STPEYAPWLERALKGEAVEALAYSAVLDSDVYRLLRPITLGHSKAPWIVMTVLVKDTIEAPAEWITEVIVYAAVLLVLVLIVVMSLLVVSLAATPLRRLTGVVDQMAGGNTDVGVPGTGRGDELGVMAKAIEVFRQKLIEIEALRAQTQAAEAEAAAARRR